MPLPHYIIWRDDINKRPLKIEANSYQEALGKARERRKIPDAEPLTIVLETESERTDDLTRLGDIVHSATIKVAEYYEYTRNHCDGLTASHLTKAHSLMNSAYLAITARANEVDQEEAVRKSGKKARKSA